MLKIAHRGASAYNPENTLSAFEKAIELGADMLECDVWLTKDRQIVVIHDETVTRTTSGKGRVKDLTLLEIQKLKIFPTEKIPSLKEIFKLAKNRCQVNVEIKTSAVVDYLIEDLRQTGFPVKDLLISSNYLTVLSTVRQQNAEFRLALVFRSIDNPPFYIRFVQKTFRLLFSIKKLFPWLKIGWLFRLLTYPVFQLLWGMMMLGILPLIQFLIIDKLFSHQIEILNLDYRLATKGFIRRIHKYHKKIIVWTVNKQKTINKFKRWQVDGIITNYPNRL